PLHDALPILVKPSELLQEYHLIKHTDTKYFGEKAVIYIGDINRLSLPEYMTSSSHQQVGFTINSNENYYEQIAGQISQTNDNVHKIIVVEITKEEKKSIHARINKKVLPTVEYRLFDDKLATTITDKYTAPFWYETPILYDEKKENPPVIFLVTGDQLKSYNKQKTYFTAAVGLVVIFIAYLYRTGHTPDFINNLI